MKKYSAWFLLIQTGTIMFISSIIGIAIYVAIGVRNAIASGMQGSGSGGCMGSPACNGQTEWSCEE